MSAFPPEARRLVVLVLAVVVMAALPASSSARSSHLSPVIDGISVVLDVETGAQVGSVEPGVPFEAHVVVDSLSGYFMSACQFGLQIDPRLVVVDKIAHPDVTFLEELTPGDIFLGWGTRLDLRLAPHVLLTLQLVLPPANAAATDITVQLRPHTTGQPLRWAQWPESWIFHDLVDAGGVILDPTAPGIVTFAAAPPILIEGRELLLDWDTFGSEDVLLDGEPVDPEGLQTLSPTSDQLYVLTVDPDGVRVEAKADVQVIREPRIDRFIASNPDPGLGELVQVRWEIRGADQVRLDPMGSPVGPISGLQAEYDGPTVFGLTATNEWGSTRALLELGSSTEPTIPLFRADDLRIDRGEDVTLDWLVAGADEVTLEPGVGVVPAYGEVTVQPFESTTYVLTARRGPESVQQTLTVEVSPVRIEVFRATPPRVYPSQTVELAWKTVSATSVWIEPGIGAVEPWSEMVVTTPADSTTYTLFAESAEGEVVSVSRTVTWILPQPRPEAILGSFPSGDPEDGRWMLQASVYRATGVTIEPGGIAYEIPWKTHLQQAFFPVEPRETTVYTLNAFTEYDTVTSSTTVLVEPVAGLRARPSRPTAGEPFDLILTLRGALAATLEPGSIRILPPEDTTLRTMIDSTMTYTLTATSAFGSATATLTVETANNVSTAFQSVSLERLPSEDATALRYHAEAVRPLESLEIWRAKGDEPLAFYQSLRVGNSEIEAGVWVDERPLDQRSRYRLRASLEGFAQWSPDVWIEGRVPFQTRLYDNLPNPFNPSTTIRFELAEAGDAELSIHDAAGRRVRTVDLSQASAGPGRWRWDGRDDRGFAAASGVYVVRLRTAGTTDALRVTLLK